MGQIKHDRCDSYEQAKVRYAEAEVRRDKRGYALKGACPKFCVNGFVFKVLVSAPQKGL
jgi:hypothetical protein